MSSIPSPVERKQVRPLGAGELPPLLTSSGRSAMMLSGYQPPC